MHLLRMRLAGLGPFEEIELGFTDDDGEPRPITVVHGSGGVGKTTLLTALAATRPGHAVVSSSAPSEREEPGVAVCEYRLGQDDPDRPHPLVVATPTARAYAQDDREALRRREQALFDRVAREAGFAFVAIPATRWFSRQPLALVGPSRGVARYDVRSPLVLDDPSRGDLARETKQALAYAAIAAAVAAGQPAPRRFEWFASAMQHAVDALVGLSGYRYAGVLDPLTLEPLFEDASARVVSFDSLPTRARHLAAFAALPVRALWAARPARDPLEAEGIVAIDEVDSLQDPSVLGQLVPALRSALPCVQWIVTTTSPLVAASCDLREVIALRRIPEQGRVELFTGPMARTH